MDFVSNQEEQRQEMLKAIGVTSIGELFAAVPEKLRCSPPSTDDGISEFEGIQLMEHLGKKNTFPHYENYLGGGAYEHHVPALVGAICGKSEFLTGYTPYQAEVSQGMLQAIFEFQSAICALTGMDVSNASVFDAASACTEATLMAIRTKKGRKKVLVASTLHPHYRQVMEQVLSHQEIALISLPFLPNGRLDHQAFQEALDENTIAVLFQSPNFLGIMENLPSLTPQIKEAGALTILCANPMAYGLYASAGELGADIAIGDTQPFGLPLQYGGPYVGYIACRQELVRQLPGRLVGETVDTQGNRGFVLTLQAREQHIRREKATSNICTNQALAALASLVAICWYGKQGVKELALTNYQRTAYLKGKLEQIPQLKTLSDAPHFNEFVVKFPKPFDQVQQHFRNHHIEPGIHLGTYFPTLNDHFLIAVTETKNQAQLDRYVEIAQEIS